MNLNNSNKIIIFIPLIILIGLVVFLFNPSSTQNTAINISTQNDIQEASTLKQALDQALLDEYKAKSTYDSVIAQFGSVRPFINIVRAEENHISSLESLYQKYNLTNPTPSPLEIQKFSSLKEACAFGVQAEVENVKLYKDKLLPQVADYPDVKNTFNQLMSASQNNHLPALSRCSQ